MSRLRNYYVTVYGRILKNNNNNISVYFIYKYPYNCYVLLNIRDIISYFKKNVSNYWKKKCSCMIFVIWLNSIFCIEILFISWRCKVYDDSILFESILYDPYLSQKKKNRYDKNKIVEINFSE